MEYKAKTRTKILTGLTKKCFQDSWNQENGFTKGHLITGPLVPVIIGVKGFVKTFNPKNKDKETGEYVIRNY